MRAAADHDAKAARSLWRFSLALYARPGVAAALVALQDRAGHDVTLLLAALWLGATAGRRLAAADLAAARIAADPVAGPVVAPLRSLRRRLRQSPEPDLADLRRHVGAVELTAERAVLRRLAACLTARHGGAAGTAAADRLAAAEANLALCLGADIAAAEADTLRRAAAALMRRAPNGAE